MARGFPYSGAVLVVQTVKRFFAFLARDVIYTSRAYATVSVSVCLSVTEVHCGRGAWREEGRGHLALC